MCVTRDAADKDCFVDYRWELFFFMFVGVEEASVSIREEGGVKASPVSHSSPPSLPHSLPTNGTDHATSFLLIVLLSRLFGGPFIAPPRLAPHPARGSGARQWYLGVIFLSQEKWRARAAHQAWKSVSPLHHQPTLSPWLSPRPRASPHHRQLSFSPLNKKIM